MSELYLIRHAQASFGTDNYDLLSELGVKQSRWLGEHFAQAGIQFDQFLTGDLVRHHQTLDGILDGMGGSESQRQVHTGFNEYNFQHLVSRFGDKYPNDALYQLMRQNPVDKRNYYRLLRRVLTAWAEDSLPDSRESWAQFSRRVGDAQQLVKSLSTPGNRILAVSSGGAISTFVGLVLELAPERIFDLNLQTKNTGISHFYFNSEKLNLSSFNAIPHLEINGRSEHITYG